MRIAAMNWMQVEAQVQRDDRCVLPIGSTEQHAQLSLATDAILAERVAVEAAEPIGVPVFPVVSYGLTPYFAAYPGTVTLRLETLTALVRDIVASIRRSGFRRLLVVNGHGGNQPVAALTQELMLDHPDMAIRFHNWWNAPATLAAVEAVDSVGSHASWMENFPWTRLEGVDAPSGVKPLADRQRMTGLGAAGVRALLGDGNMGGAWEKPDEDMLRIWQTGVEETRAALEGPWPDRS